jgi:hypothetical protein
VEERGSENSISAPGAPAGSMLVNGVLDPEGGAALRSALEPLARRSGEHDHREREQRLADE